MSTATLEESIAQCQSQRPDGLWEGVARIEGIDCGACAVEIEQEAGQVGGFFEFSLNPASGMSHWVADTPECIESLSHRIKPLGYRLGSETSDPAGWALRNHVKSRRKTFLRWLVATLCMMQVMMYAGPEYFYTAAEIGLQEAFLLRWAQWLLVWPVVLYSASGIFSSAFRGVRACRWNMDQPIALGMSVAFAYSSSQLLNPQGHVWFDSIAMLASLLLLSRWMVERWSARAVMRILSAKPDLPAMVACLRADAWVETAVSKLRAGDRIRVERGQSLPLDVQVPADVPAVFIDNSVRTGESEPLRVLSGGQVDAGSRVAQGVAEFTVAAAGKSGFLQQMGRDLQAALAAKPTYQQEIDRITPWFAGTVMIVALLSAVFWLALSRPTEQALSVFVAVLLVSCPCALALSYPLARLFLMERLGALGVLVRHPEALDRIEKLDVLAFDKTGSLTNNSNSEVQFDTAGARVGFWQDGDSVTSLAFTVAQQSRHPVSRALSRALVGTLNSQEMSRWMVMNAKETAGEGVSALVMDRQTGRSLSVRLGRPEFCGDRSRKHDGLTVLSVAERATEDSFDPKKAVWVVLATAKVGFPEALISPVQLDRLGQSASLVLLSGDSASAVQAWEPRLKFSHRLGGLAPQEKAHWIRGVQQRGHVVMMVGDGLNDAVSFGQADIAVACAGAVGWTAQQADVLLQNNSFEGLEDLIRASKFAVRVARQNMAWSLAYNAIGFGLAAGGLLTPGLASIGMGLSSLVVLLNSMRIRGRGLNA